MAANVSGRLGDRSESSTLWTAGGGRAAGHWCLANRGGSRRVGYPAVGSSADSGGFHAG